MAQILSAEGASGEKPGVERAEPQELIKEAEKRWKRGRIALAGMLPQSEIWLIVVVALSALARMQKRFLGLRFASAQAPRRWRRQSGLVWTLS